MADGGRKPSFWETVPGIITAIAALITALATLITALYTAKIIGQHEEPVKKEAGKEQGDINKQQKETPAENQVERKGSVAEAAAKEPVEAKQLKQGDTMTDPTTGMEFVYVPGGCFKRIFPENRHIELCVDGFWMGKYEVTQGQWIKIMGSNPAHFQKGEDYPVEQVSWSDVQEFIHALNSKSGRIYRLPNDAEWEYACRANSPGKYCGGDELNAVAWYSGNSEESTHPVGGKRKNSFGLYDMSGNVSEWSDDWHFKKYYVKSDENPRKPIEILRGGSYADDDTNGLGFSISDYRSWDSGFRLVFPVQQGK